MEIKKNIKYLLVIPALMSLLFIQIEQKKEVKATWELIQSNNFVSNW